MSLPDLARTAFLEALADDDPQALYDRAPCGYLSTTARGRIVKANQTFLTWTGYAMADLLDQPFTELLTAGGRLYHETHFAPLLRLQGSVREIALDLVCADGSRLSVLVNATADLDASGQPVIVRIAVFDATERRQYERELLGAKVRAEQSEQRASELARTLQQALLPPRTPEIPGLTLEHVFRAAGEGAEVGGDFYDTFQLGEDDWVVVIGDVCGKGVDAAVVTMLVRHTLRAVTVGLDAPSQALDALNDVLLRHDTERFCTVAMVRLRRDDAGWTATASAGGHPEPLLCRADGKILGWAGHGPLLGVIEGATFTDQAVHLGPRDGLVLYTDGVTEARNGRELFGEARVRAVLAQAQPSPEARVSALLSEVERFSGGAPRDDVAIVALQVS